MLDPRTGKNIVAAPQALPAAPTAPILRTQQRNIGAPQALPTTPAVTPAPPATTSHGAFVTDPGTGQPYGPQAGWSPGFQKFGQDMTQGLVAPALTPTQPSPATQGRAGGGGLVPVAQAQTPTAAPPVAKPATITDPTGRQGITPAQVAAMDAKDQPLWDRWWPEDAAPALAAPAAASGGVDVIRGTNVQRGGAGAGDGSPEGLRNDIASRIQFGIDAGSPLAGYGPELAFLKGIPEAAAKGSQLPTRSQVEGQLLSKDPALLKQIYGKATPARRTRIVEQAVAPPLDADGNPGFSTGQKEFFNVDLDTGRSTPVDLSGREGAEGAKPSLAKFLAAARKDPRNAQVSDEDLTKHYRQNYGR